jgi:hypothetical protein
VTRLPTDGTCAAVREEIRERWLAMTLERAGGRDDPGAAAAPDLGRVPKQALQEHFEACPECRSEADELLFVDASLERSFRHLGERTPAPGESRMEETVRLLRGPVEAELIRKIRRPIRFLLWTAFYLFTLLASLTLAVAVMRALAS